MIAETSERNAWTFAERFVASRYGTESFGHMHLAWDLVIDGVPVDVKSVPLGARFCNGGNKCPSALVVIVESDDTITSYTEWSKTARILGVVPRGGPWRKDKPPIYGGRLCWMTDRYQWEPIERHLPLTVDEPDETIIETQRLVLGAVDPRMHHDPDEMLRADWRDRDRRRRLRARSRPESMWGEADPPATGLSDRRGHAPGKENYRRIRP